MVDDTVKMSIKKSCTKRKYKKLFSKQRVLNKFNTGTRVHRDKKKYYRKAKHKEDFYTEC